MQTELLPFNLEEALKNPERVVYRNGEKPLEWHWFDKAFSNFSVYSIKQNGMIEDHLIDGSVIDKVCPNEYDLLLHPNL